MTTQQSGLGTKRMQSSTHRHLQLHQRNQQELFLSGCRFPIREFNQILGVKVVILRNQNQNLALRNSKPGDLIKRLRVEISCQIFLRCKHNHANQAFVVGC